MARRITLNNGTRLVKGNSRGEFSQIGGRDGMNEFPSDQAGYYARPMGESGGHTMPIYKRQSNIGNQVANKEKASARTHSGQLYNIRKAFGLSVG